MATAYDARWREVRLQALERDGWICQLRLPGCTVDATEGDHIVSLEDGGARLDLSNVRASCKHCNSSRGASQMRERYRWAKRYMAGDSVSEAGPSREWW